VEPERIVIEWGGERWARYPNAEQRAHRVYYQSLKRRKCLHIAIWEHHNKRPCPDGWHVHHRDGDPFNNDPGNLEALSPEDHDAAHRELGDCEWRTSPEWLAHLADIRPLAAAWHRSPEGRAWHVEHGARTWADRAPSAERSCEQCEERFTPMQGHARWCSKVCRERWYDANRTYHKPAICECCGGQYLRRKRTVRYCSRACGARARRRVRTTGV